MKTKQKKDNLITPEMIDGPMMIPGQLTEENRLAIIAIIEKNKAEKAARLQTASLKH